MAYAHVQSKSQAFGNSASARTLQFDSNVTINDLLIVAVAIYANNVTVTVSDTQVNSWSQVGGYEVIPFDTNARLAIFYAVANSTDSSPNTITVTPSASAFLTLGIHEYSGNDTASPLDGSNQGDGTGSSMDSGSITVSAANELLFGAFTTVENIYTTTAGSGFTLRADLNASNMPLSTEDQIVSTNTNATFSTDETDHWGCIGASFKVASAGGGGGVSNIRRR